MHKTREVGYIHRFTEKSDKRCVMYRKGLTVVLTQPIEGKKDRFEKGLRGTIVESFELAHGKSYRVQFVDGRVARFPEELMNQAIEVLV